MTDIIPPATLYSIHPFRQYSSEQNNLWKQLFLILDQIYVRTGGTTDEIEEQLNLISANENQIAFVQALANYLQEQVNDLKADMMPLAKPVPDYNPVVTSVDYVAVDFDFVNAKNNCKVTFPQYPTVNSFLIIRVGDNSAIKIDGNGKKINGCYTGVLKNKGRTVKFFYFIDDDEWYAE